MKKLLVSSLLLMQTYAFAQTEKQDFLSFTPPAGWQRSTPYQTITYEDKRNTNVQYAFVQVYRSLASSGNAQANYEHFWKELITATYQQTAPKPEITSKNGWVVLTGKSSVYYSGVRYTAILQVFNSPEKTLPIFILYDKDSYQTEVSRFLASIQVPQIGASHSQSQANSTSPTPNSTSSKIKITYPTTNFDDGWVSVLEDNFVRTSKANLEVRLYYPDKEIIDRYPNGSGKTLEQYLLETLLGQEFQFLQWYERRKDAFAYGESDIFEANAKEKRSGRNAYVALASVFDNGICQPVAIIAPSKELLYASFPNYKAMEAMTAYNKFAVGKNDLLGGTWISSGASLSNYYNIYTGAFVGSSTTATTDDFVFKANDTYQSEHGIYHNGKYTKQNYNGKFTINQWSITATNRFNNETSDFWCEFRAVKGGVILVMVNKKYTGQRYTLALKR